MVLARIRSVQEHAKASHQGLAGPDSAARSPLKAYVSSSGAPPDAYCNPVGVVAGMPNAAVPSRLSPNPNPRSGNQEP